MEAVHSRTSREIQISHSVRPRFHDPVTSTLTASGITSTPTDRSAHARLDTKRLVMVRSFGFVSTLSTTRALPTTAPRAMEARMMPTKTACSNDEAPAAAADQLSSANITAVELTSIMTDGILVDVDGRRPSSTDRRKFTPSSYSETSNARSAVYIAQTNKQFTKTMRQYWTILVGLYKLTREDVDPMAT